MEVWQAILLGVVQGLAEFLPISSSGHLLMVQTLMDVEWTADESISFFVALHAGTLVALIAYFRDDLMMLVRGAIAGLRERDFEAQERKLPWFILLGTVPAILAYLAFTEFLRAVEDRPEQVAVMLVLFSFVFIIAERFRGNRRMGDVRWYHAFLIGCGQAVALLPGTSRSGATISTGMLLGFDRQAAARFSFLLSAPVVTAAFVLELPHIVESGAASQEYLVATVAGFIAAAVSGYVAVAALLRFLGSNSLSWFAVYRIPVGLLFLFYLGTQ